MRWMLSLALVLMACGGEDQAAADQGNPDRGMPDAESHDMGGDPFTDSSVVDHGLPDGQLPPECDPGTRYVPGSPMFVERTDESGLSAIGASGVMLSVADINGDGFPDILARRGGSRADYLGDEPIRNTWLMLNQGDGTFIDHTIDSGYLAIRGDYGALVGRPNWVAAFADVDNDGDLDIYSGFDTRNPINIDRMGERLATVDEETSELLLNDGTGHFELTYRNDPLRRAGRTDVPSGVAFIDVNHDGNIDLWMSQGGLGAPLQDRLFINEGDATFADKTAEYGLGTLPWEGATTVEDLNAGLGHTTAWSAQACDLNGDGIPELMAGSYGRAPNHLWQGTEREGVIRYSNRSVSSGYAYDENQVWQDDEFARCFCQSNPEAPDCADAPAPNVQCQANWDHNTGRQAFRLGGNSGATLCADFDNDGDFDLYTTEIRHWWAGQGADWAELLVNTGEGDVRFDRPGREATGLVQSHAGANWDEGNITATTIDVDNDGREDIYVGGTDYPGNRGLLFHNISEGSPMFESVPAADFFEHNRSHGSVVADFDRDGDLDMVVGHSRGRCGTDMMTPCYPTTQMRYFENVLGQDGHWVQLTLEGGEGTNRAAIGARVTVTAGELLVVKEVRGGYGHFGQQNDLVVHVGLGDRCTASVTVRWPNAELTEQTFQVISGQRYQVVQGSDPVVIP